jgi:TRAP-type C4-dicarboxylate transport system substrate-binding protein
MRVLTVLLGFTISLLAAGAQAQEFILKVSHFMPSVSSFQKDVLEPWCDRLTKDSGSRLKCQIFPSMQLGGTPAQLVDQVKNGVADVVWTAPSYSQGRFPIIEAVELPFTMPGDGLRGSLAIWEFYGGYAQKEFESFKVLAFHSGGGQVLNTARKPALNLVDFRGMKLRSPSRLTSKLLNAIGSAPVSMPASQVTEAVAKGVVDGALGPWDLVPAVKLDEVAKFHVEHPANDAAFAVVALGLLMNKEKYNSLPPDLKAVIDRHSGLTLVKAFGASWDRSIEAARKRARDLGNKVVELTPASYAELRAAARGVEQGWVKEVEAKGLDAAKLVPAVRAIGAKYLK